MIIPTYLKSISQMKEKNKYSVLLKMKCDCGNSFFEILENKTIKPECKHTEVIQENGKWYYVKRRLLGLIKSKVECTYDFSVKQRKIIKIRCTKCGKEHLIFDNHLHGFDAIINKEENVDQNVLLVKTQENPLEVYVKIYQEISYEDFVEEFDMSREDYLLSFSSIDIYGTSSKSRKVKIYSEETA